MKNFLIVACCLFISTATLARNQHCYFVSQEEKFAELPSSSELPAQRDTVLSALRITDNIRVDGNLDEAIWSQAEKTVDFIERRPNPGTKSSQSSRVSVLYDDSGVYVGAMLYDENPDSILNELTERDELGNTDFFGFIIDTYQSGLNGFEFLVTPGNVQFDATTSEDRGEDTNWDAVWSSSTSITDEGWVVEMFIPYSAIRFPKTSEQTWGLNFVRKIQREQEQSFWSEIRPDVDGFLTQAGQLTDIVNIKAPFRLQLTPFVTAIGVKQTNPAAETTKEYGTSLGGGLDLKLGLSDAFTLDMTVIPDFSEARSDDNILNLGPFEQRFDEQRAFFTEGTELFNKGGFFYSRRVGGRNYKLGSVRRGLAEGEELSDFSSKAQLVNATKISGRTAKGTGIGFFNAIEKTGTATVTDADGNTREEVIHPFTNYNVAVIDQNLPNNSSVTLINTNVMREGAATDANVTGLVFNLRNKANSYSLGGSGGYSQRFMADDTERGHRLNLTLAEITGNWQFRISYSEESDTYNPNDLGLLFNNNERNFWGRINYNKFEPFLNGFFLNGGAGMWLGQDRLYRDNKYVGDNVEFWVYGQTKHFWNVNFWTDHDYSNWYDYFEPRVEGRYVRINPRSNVGGWIGSDNRKKLRVSANFNTDRYWGDEAERREFRYNLNLRYRFSNRFSLSSYAFRGNSHGDLGYVNREDRSYTGEDGLEYEATDVFMGRRTRRVMEVGLDGKYSFTANMTLNLRVRHYWDRVNYDSFHLLNEDGNLSDTDYNDHHDLDFDAFNVDLIYRWRFAPGSDILLVYKSNVSVADQDPQRGYFNNWRKLWRNSPTNDNLSLKVIYWLDYASIVK
ncbi:hypothetical protein CEQ90_09860 [Lewinellaceae bacterium SD302]|nr:hypothetical protein CEQ90_09860 [Lewinellaceae bacterium SD302]